MLSPVKHYGRLS